MIELVIIVLSFIVMHMMIRDIWTGIIVTILSIVLAFIMTGIHLFFAFITKYKYLYFAPYLLWAVPVYILWAIVRDESMGLAAIIPLVLLYILFIAIALSIPPFILVKNTSKYNSNETNSIV